MCLHDSSQPERPRSSSVDSDESQHKHPAAWRRAFGQKDAGLFWARKLGVDPDEVEERDQLLKLNGSKS